MTNQELCDKIDALYNAGEFEEIVSIVENLPEKEQNGKRIALFEPTPLLERRNGRHYFQRHSLAFSAHQRHSGTSSARVNGHLRH